MNLDYQIAIPDRLQFKIGEVAKLLRIKPHVLRYWESEFSLLAPTKSRSQQRMYSRADVENALLIKHLLYDLRFSIEGAKKRIAEIRKKGELKESRKPQVTMNAEFLTSLAQAKKELEEILELCAISV